jgi:hypothetical protein
VSEIGYPRRINRAPGYANAVNLPAFATPISREQASLIDGELEGERPTIVVPSAVELAIQDGHGTRQSLPKRQTSGRFSGPQGAMWQIPAIFRRYANKRKLCTQMILRHSSLVGAHFA